MAVLGTGEVALQYYVILWDTVIVLSCTCGHLHHYDQMGLGGCSALSSISEPLDTPELSPVELLQGGVYYTVFCLLLLGVAWMHKFASLN